VTLPWPGGTDGPSTGSALSTPMHQIVAANVIITSREGRSLCS